MENIDFSKLPKKERKRLKREMEREEHQRRSQRGGLVKLGLLTALVAALALGIFWLVREGGKPLPGQTMPDLGRTHVPKEEWEKFSYNSNPPTSGPHDATWIKAGIYDSPQGDGFLIHALEHGYVILSYNCERKISNLEFRISNLIYAHETEEMHEEPMASESAEASVSSQLTGDVWEGEDCQQLKKQLSDLAEEKKLWKLIVVPRPNLDVAIALTAWARIAKLDKFEKQEINSFIDNFRNRGPEATAE